MKRFSMMMGGAFAVALLAGCAAQQQTQAPQTPQQMCTAAGGAVEVMRAEGRQVQVCVFAGGVCEMNAFASGVCPPGGYDISRWVNAQPGQYKSATAEAGQIYCVITGGTLTNVSDPKSFRNETVCTLPGGLTCTPASLWSGTCP